MQARGLLMTNMGSTGPGTGTLEVCISCLNVFVIVSNLTDSSTPSYGWRDHWKKWRMY